MHTNRLELAADGKRHNRRLVAREIVLAARLQRGERVLRRRSIRANAGRLRDARKAGSVQQRHRRRARVKGRRRRIHIVEEAGDRGREGGRAEDAGGGRGDGRGRRHEVQRERAGGLELSALEAGQMQKK